MILLGPPYRKQQLADAPSLRAEDEARLLEAEKRVAYLVDKADALHTIVTRRDQPVHWQDAVNHLFRRHVS